MAKRPDWTGYRLNHLTILGKGPVNTEAKDRHSLWVGLCDCGKKRLVRSNELCKGSAKHCGEFDCPYRNRLPQKTQRGVPVRLSQAEVKEALSQPCRLCGTPYDKRFVLGLYNPKLGYVAGNTFPLCHRCQGFQPPKARRSAPVIFEEIILHICRVLTFLSDTGDITSEVQ